MSFVLGLVLGVALASVALIPAAHARARSQARRERDAVRRALAAERLAEIGAMTGGLAHEIKNPLSTIGLNAQLLAEAIRETPISGDDADQQGARLVKRTETLRREADRLRDILEDFLRFAGELCLDRRRTDINAVVDELVDFYLPQAEHHGVRLRAETAPGPLPASIDAPHLKQAVLNLMLNATQAMEAPQGAAADAGAGGPRELILRTAGGRDGIELHVIDTGPGIPEEKLARIFAPYFTTKAGGSGLGLPTARRIVEAHDGSIEVMTEPGRGTDFVIHLPPAGDAGGDATVKE
jgi:signal transduction histidine kinase